MCFKYSDPDTREKLIKIDGSDVRVRNGKSLVQLLAVAKEQTEEVGRSFSFDDVPRITGMCIWSFPYGEQEMKAVDVMSNLITEHGVVLPYPNLAYDEQPALFFQFLNVYQKAKSDFMELTMSRMGNGTS